jgi:Dolichyl-phosphate-mannose-protein mannosyltransferase
MIHSVSPTSGRVPTAMAGLDSAPADGLPSRGGKALLVVIVVGLAIRLAFFAAAYHNGGGLAAAHSSNTDQYLRTAKSLLSTGQFAVDGTPELLRSPGYPLFLIPGLVAGQPELVTIALQLLLSAATIWLIYDNVLYWTDRRAAALGAAILAAIEPLSVIFCSVLMTETLFTFLMVLSVRQLLRYLATDALAPLVQTALLLVMATFVRPVNYYLPTILAALLLARAFWRSEDRLRSTGYAAVFWVVSMSPLVAWQVRNYTETGYSAFAAIADFNLYFFHGAAVIAHERGLPVETVQAELGFNSPAKFDQLHPELNPADQAARFRFLHSEGVRLIRQHSWTFGKIYLRGLAILVFNPGASEVLGGLHCLPTDRPLRPANLGLLGLARHMQATAPRLFYSNLFLLGALAAAYLTAALGLASQLRRLSWQLIALTTVAFYFLAVSGGATSLARLRHPAMPLILILSGIGISQVVAWWHRFQTVRRATAEVPPKITHQAAA